MVARKPTRLVVDSPLSWSIWTKLFVLVVTVGLAGQIYMFMSFRADIHQRRATFCETENTANRKQVMLWEGVIRISQEDPENQTAAGKDRAKRFVEFVKETFPMRNCDDF